MTLGIYNHIYDQSKAAAGTAYARPTLGDAVVPFSRLLCALRRNYGITFSPSYRMVTIRPSYRISLLCRAHALLHLQHRC